MGWFSINWIHPLQFSFPALPKTCFREDRTLGQGCESGLTICAQLPNWQPKPSTYNRFFNEFTGQNVRVCHIICELFLLQDPRPPLPPWPAQKQDPELSDLIICAVRYNQWLSNSTKTTFQNGRQPGLLLHSSEALKILSHFLSSTKSYNLFL